MQINTNFGTRNEHVAIVEYEKRTGLKVEGNNDTRYEMLFPTPKGFWKFVAKPEVRCRGVPLKGLQLLKASQLHADADNVDNNKALGRVSNCAIKEPSTATSADSCGVDPTDSPDSEFSDVELDIESVEEALTSVDTANFASDSAIDDDSIVAILSSDSEDDTMPPEQNGLLEFMEHLTKTFGSRQIGPTEAEKSCTGCAGDGSGCCRLIATNVSRHQRKFLHRVATDLSLGHGTIRQRREPNSASMATAFWVWDQRAQLQVINSMKPADGSQQDAATTSVAPYCSFLRNVLETIFGSSCQEHASKRRNRERSVGVKSLNLGDNTWRIDPTNASKQDAHSASKWRQPRPLFKICGMVDGLTIDTISISSASASTAKRRATLSVEQKQRIARSRQKAMRKRQQLSRAASKPTWAPHMPSAISTMYPSVFHHLNFKLRLKNPPSTQGGQTQIEPRRKTEDLPLDNVDPRSRVVVEIKNRMTSIKQPPPFYDQVRCVMADFSAQLHSTLVLMFSFRACAAVQVQSVVYMLMLKCIHADLVQYLKVGKQEQPAGAGEPIRGEQQPPDNPPLTLAVDRINLHGAPCVSVTVVFRGAQLTWLFITVRRCVRRHYHSRNWDNEVVPRLCVQNSVIHALGRRTF